jgi:hypothetical protein
VATGTSGSKSLEAAVPWADVPDRTFEERIARARVGLQVVQAYRNGGAAAVLTVMREAMRSRVVSELERPIGHAGALMDHDSEFAVPPWGHVALEIRAASRAWFGDYLVMLDAGMSEEAARVAAVMKGDVGE